MTTKVLSILMLLIISNPFLVALKEDSNFCNITACNHTYSYSPVGKNFDQVNKKGETECMQTFIGVCDECGIYYYTNIHVFWYE